MTSSARPVGPQIAITAVIGALLALLASCGAYSLASPAPNTESVQMYVYGDAG